MANSLNAEAFGLGVHQDQKKGSAVVNSTDIDDLDGAINEALELAKYSLSDEYLVMPDAKEAPPAAELNFLYDKAMHEVTPEQIEHMISKCLETELGDPRIAVERFEVSIGSSLHTLISSENVQQSESQTGVSWSIVGMARDGDEVSGMDYLGGHSFSWKGVSELVEKDCRDFAETVLSNLKPIKCPSYKGPIIISPRSIRPLLISTMLYHSSGSSVMDGKSRWADKEGEEVASPFITLLDNPHSGKLAGATAYDADGLPTVEQKIFDKGRLVRHLHSCYSANRCGTKSNALSGGPFALSLEAGDRTMQDLFNLRSEILLVGRFSGNVDPLTGDFSGVAKSSHFYRNGEKVGAVKEVMIAGNVFDIMKQVIGTTRDTSCISSGFIAPWVAVDGVSVS